MPNQLPTQIPTDAVGGNDILAPVQALLRGMSILPADGDMTKTGPAAAVTGGPDSVSIIEAGGTALSKGFASLIALVGGATVVTTVVTGFWKHESTSVRVTLLGGSAFLLAAAAIAIALIVASDVAGRASGAVALYDARRHVATALLELSLTAHLGDSGSADSAVAPVTSRPRAGGGTPVGSGTILELAVSGAPAPVLQKSSGVYGTLSGIRGSEGTLQLQITRADGDKEWCEVDQLELREFTWSPDVRSS